MHCYLHIPFFFCTFARNFAMFGMKIVERKIIDKKMIL